MRKIAFFVVGVFVASFALERAQSLCANRGLSGPIAYAQDADDSADTPDALTSPNIEGDYKGSVQSHNSGTGTIEINIEMQNRSKVSGSWQTDLGGGLTGIVSGSVKPNDHVHLKLGRPGHRCSFNFQGIFEHGDEISGTYHSNGCHPSDFGMIDATD